MYSDQLYKLSVSLLVAELPSAALSELLQLANAKPIAAANNAFGTIRPIRAGLSGWDNDKWVKIFLLNKMMQIKKLIKIIRQSMLHVANKTIMVITLYNLKGYYQDDA
jgi:hypothetical protein